MSVWRKLFQIIWNVECFSEGLAALLKSGCKGKGEGSFDCFLSRGPQLCYFGFRA